MLPASVDRSWLPRVMATTPVPRSLTALTLIGLAIRLYLSLTSFCIASDGMEYVRMAQQFASGAPEAALRSVFSPLYPLLIALAHRAVSDWELAGNLVSALLGTASIPLLFLLMFEVFERDDLAVGAAGLVAIHPLMAEYSAAARTDAGFISLMIGALYLIVRGVNRGKWPSLVGAGAVAGVGYLYRAEAVGLPILCALYLIAGSFIWRRWSLAAAVGWSIAIWVLFLIVASPYLIYLHDATGRWIVSRELNLAASASVMEVASDPRAWKALAASGNTSPLAPLWLAPRAYLFKVSYDLVMSFYYFAEAAGPLPFALLVIGLWVRGRAIARQWREALLASVVLFYVLGFSLFNTGPRFMAHLMPYTFGWMMLGIERASQWIRMLPTSWGRKIPPSVPAWIVAAVLLPIALMPSGYDLRGFRYAARDLLASGERPRTIVSCDRRVAFYAGARFINLPPAPPESDICGWLRRQADANYLMLSQRDERSWGALREEPCLRFVKRYPRTGDRYYDLFQIRR
jgi:hypothetical protein